MPGDPHGDAVPQLQRVAVAGAVDEERPADHAADEPEGRAASQHSVRQPEGALSGSAVELAHGELEPIAADGQKDPARGADAGGGAGRGGDPEPARAVALGPAEGGDGVATGRAGVHVGYRQRRVRWIVLGCAQALRIVVRLRESRISDWNAG